MAKEKSLVEEAIIQMKNLEEAVAENAKGILASTMSQEIKELVKESLTEQDDEEVDTEVDMDDMDITSMDDMDDDVGNVGVGFDFNGDLGVGINSGTPFINFTKEDSRLSSYLEMPNNTQD